MTASPAYKASWTPERRAAHAEKIRQARWAKLSPQEKLDRQRKEREQAEAKERKAAAKAKRDAAKAEAAAAKAEAKARRDRQRDALHEVMGVTEEQLAERQAAKREAWAAAKAERAAQPPKRAYQFKPWPQSLDALRDGCAQHGDTVAAHAVAIAIRTWACDRMGAEGETIPGNATGNPSAVIATCLDLHLAQLWRDAGAEGHWTLYGNPALRDLSSQSRHEAVRVIAETRAEWEAAGSPGLDHPALYAAFRYLCGHVWTGRFGTFPRCLETPPYLTEGNE